MKNTGVQARLAEMGGEARGDTPEEMTAMVSAELKKWTAVVEEARAAEEADVKVLSGDVPITLKVNGVKLETLRDAIKPAVEQIIDIRATEIK